MGDPLIQRVVWSSPVIRTVADWGVHWAKALSREPMDKNAKNKTIFKIVFLESAEFNRAFLTFLYLTAHKITARPPDKLLGFQRFRAKLLPYRMTATFTICCPTRPPAVSWRSTTARYIPLATWE